MFCCRYGSDSSKRTQEYQAAHEGFERRSSGAALKHGYIFVVEMFVAGPPCCLAHIVGTRYNWLGTPPLPRRSVLLSRSVHIILKLRLRFWHTNRVVKEHLLGWLVIFIPHPYRPHNCTTNLFNLCGMCCPIGATCTPALSLGGCKPLCMEFARSISDITWDPSSILT